MNQTHAYLFATRPPETLSFSGAVTTSSIYLNGPGGQSGDGFPVPRRGILTRLDVWDGTTLHTDTDEISFNAGDRLSLYCQSSGSDFTVKVRINGNSTNLQVASVPFNRTLFATVEFLLIRE
jgi:hypothetical protein